MNIMLPQNPELGSSFVIYHPDKEPSFVEIPKGIFIIFGDFYLSNSLIVPSNASLHLLYCEKNVWMVLTFTGKIYVCDFEEKIGLWKRLKRIFR